MVIPDQEELKAYCDRRFDFLTKKCYKFKSWKMRKEHVMKQKKEERQLEVEKMIREVSGFPQELTDWLAPHWNE